MTQNSCVTKALLACMTAHETGNLEHVAAQPPGRGTGWRMSFPVVSGLILFQASGLDS